MDKPAPNTATPSRWSAEAMSLVAHAKVLSGNRLEQLVVRLQLHVRKTEVIFWIEQNWLQASISHRGGRRFYSISPEALKELYKHHRDLLRHGMRNLALFEAYVEYCFAPKHTIGEQLLDVRRDKRERAAFAEAGGHVSDDEEEDGDDENDQDMDARYRIAVAGGADRDTGDGES